MKMKTSLLLASLSLCALPLCATIESPGYGPHDNTGLANNIDPLNPTQITPDPNDPIEKALKAAMTTDAGTKKVSAAATPEDLNTE